MEKKTHIAIGVAVALYFIPFVTHKLIFLPIVLIASLLPNLDTLSGNSEKRNFLKPFSRLLSPRGILHTYTFAIVASVVIALIYPPAALPFFLGYSFHLLADSFTVKGIRPFWPLKGEIRGIVRSGKHIDRAIFVTFLIIDAFLLIFVLSSLF